MRQIYDVDSDTVITDLFNVNDDQNVIKVAHQTLDGQYYVQLIGSAAKIVNVDFLVDKAGKTAVLNADANGDLIQITTSDETIQGRILECGDWGKVGYNYFSSTFKLGVVT